MGNSHGPPNSGMAMHNANTTNVTHDVTADEKPGSPIQEEEVQQSSSGDKSVLQAKLTNLAIQIGYGGEYYVFLKVAISQGWIFLFIIFSTHNYFIKTKNKAHKYALSGI